MTRSAGRKPLTKARSDWTAVKPPPLESTVPAQAWRRRVHDGTLTAFLTSDPGLGWHLSVSHLPASPKAAQRYPTWDELTDARYTLTDPDIEFVMSLPPLASYVAVHDTTFHLHQHPAADQ